ncbi:MAG: tetratricopeptide repeat protein [Polyangiaceae bacterium]
MALASVRLMSGDPRGAAELCRRAIERAPDNNDTRELYARLLLECASPERAVEVLEPLVREDPNQGSSWLELIRAYALMGDYSRVREAIEQARPLGRGVGPGEIVLRGRLAIWAPAELASLLDLEIPDAAMSSPWQVLRVARRVVHGEDVEGDLKIFEGFAEQQQTAPRFMTVVFQTLAEIEGFRRRVEPALDHLERTVAGGLFDIVWVDRCAALAPLRAHPRFLATRAVVAERASAIREALGVV